MNRESKPGLATLFSRGLRRRCPRCGEGSLFQKWFSLRVRCPVCGLVFEENPGDTWAFWVIGDRIPVAIGIVAIYFGFRSATWFLGFCFLVTIGSLLILTMPHRKGVAVALDYYSRLLFMDPETPSTPAKEPPKD